MVVAALIAFSVVQTSSSGDLVLGMISPAGVGFVGLCLISLMLINAQAVTALTSERDGKTLELLLMTDVTAKEFIYGKLGGIIYNTKELIVIPLGLAAYLLYSRAAAADQFAELALYVAAGFLVLVAFSAMLGLHSGLSFERSRTAIANSLGTIFFLFIGIFIFMLLLVEARSSFAEQFASFVVFILAGSIALYASLSHKNPSPALMLSAGMLPFLTFYAITEFLLQGSLGVCLSIAAAYGFTTLAMIVPAVSEFDVALGAPRSIRDEVVAVSMSDFLHSTDRWLPGLAAMLALMGLSAFLSASETALFFLSHDEIRGFRMGRARERAAAALLSDPDRVLTGILFWNLVVNLMYFAVSIVVSQRLISAHLHTAAGVFGFVALVALLLWGEVVPKVVAAIWRRSLAPLVALPIVGMVRLLDPALPLFRR